MKKLKIKRLSAGRYIIKTKNMIHFLNHRTNIYPDYITGKLVWEIGGYDLKSGQSIIVGINTTYKTAKATLLKSILQPWN